VARGTSTSSCLWAPYLEASGVGQIHCALKRTRLLGTTSGTQPPYIFPAFPKLTRTVHIAQTHSCSGQLSSLEEFVILFLCLWLMARLRRNEISHLSCFQFQLPTLILKIYCYINILPTKLS
jgi:hypothetical protein